MIKILVNVEIDFDENRSYYRTSQPNFVALMKKLMHLLVRRAIRDEIVSIIVNPMASVDEMASVQATVMLGIRQVKVSLMDAEVKQNPLFWVAPQLEPEPAPKK